MHGVLFEMLYDTVIDLSIVSYIKKTAYTMPRARKLKHTLGIY